MKCTVLLHSALVALISYSVTAQDYTPLSAADARARLAQHGITTNKPEPATSLQGVMANTINEAIALKSQCRCDLIVTGGTERGHSSAHSQGFKLDYRITPSLGKFITHNYQPISNLGRWKRWQDPKGNIYMHETHAGGNSHWDVLYKPKPLNETL